MRLKHSAFMKWIFMMPSIVCIIWYELKNWHNLFEFFSSLLTLTSKFELILYISVCSIMLNNKIAILNLCLRWWFNTVNYLGQRPVCRAYTDCILCRWIRPPPPKKRCLGYDTKLNSPVGWGCRIHQLNLCRQIRLLSSTSVFDVTLNYLIVRLWGMCNTPSLLLLSGPLC